MAGIAEHQVGYGAAAAAALRALVAEHQGTDPLAPVTVVVPSAFAGVALRRDLIATRAVANVRFLPVAQVAELLAARRLAASGRTPLTGPLFREHVRQALAAAPGALGAAVPHPATERLAWRALSELRRATSTGEQRVLAALDAGPPLPRTLAGLHRHLRAAVAPLHYDEHDLALAAAEEVPAAADLGGVIVFLPEALAPAQRVLLRALGTHTRVDVLRGGPVDAEPVPDEAVSAPDADEEVRGVVRAIARLLRQGRPLSRVAVLYADPDPYATLAAEHLTAADLPVNGPVARTLAQTIPGRTLLDLLALPDADYARPAVLDWMGVAPLPLPVDRWREVAEAAGVGRGREQWFRRLRAHGQDAAALLAFLDTLFTGLDGQGRDGTWRGVAEWSLGLLDRCLGAARDAWPEQDRQAEDTVRERLGSLAALDAAGGRAPADLPALRRVLRAELDEPAGRLGQVGVGVYLGPLESALALAFDHVFVVGMAEGSFPARPAEQPLLGDALRRQLRSAALPTRDDRLARQRTALLAVLSSGARTVLSHPRSDRRQQRERMPSPDFIRLAERAREHSSVPSMAAAVEQAAEPATVSEWVARELVATLRRGEDVAAAPVVAADPALSAAVQVVRQRAASRFTRWDGLVGPSPALEHHLAGRHAPTSLSRYATCPRQYLLGTVLGVREREDRDDPLALEGAQRGLVFHAILERFLGALAADPPATADERRHLLHRLADRALTTPAGGLRGRLEADRMRTWLDRWFDEHEALADELDVAPVGAEVGFGQPSDDLGALEVDLESGRRLALHGRIDRLDAAPDGAAALVLDYKTSSDDGYRGIESDPVLKGTQLQLAVYALAVAERHPSAQVDARYWFLGPRTTRASQRGFRLDDQRRRRTLEVLDVLTEGIAAGAFPARPGAWDDFRSDYAHCRSCAFERICPPPGERERTWERDASAPQVERYRQLVEP